MYGNYYGMNYGGYQNPYTPGVPDGLAQLRAAQGQQVQSNLPGMIWVLGEAEARSYPVAPGTKVVLWDKDTPTIFIKAADGTGLPSFKILEYHERAEQGAPAPQAVPSNEYLTRKEFEEWAAKFAPQEVINNG